jgi:outer membrane protein assembly factor BamB
MRYPLLVRLAVVLALVPRAGLMAQTSQPGSVASWRQVGFDAGQTYFNPYENVLNASNVGNLGVLWEVLLNAAGEGNSVPQPLTTDADIIIAGDNGADPSLSGLDESSGDYVWQNDEGNGAAAINDGIAFSSNIGRTLSAVNATNGATVWIANLAPGFSDYTLPTTAADGKVLISDISGTFWAVDQSTGRLLWNYDMPAPAFYPAAAANGRAFVCAGGTCYAFNRSGDLLWHLSGGGNSVVASGKVVFASTKYGTLALDAATGRTIWRYTVGGSSVAAALANKILYTSGHTITALNAETGSVIWTAPVSTHFPVAVANGVLYAHADSGTLYAIDTKTGATLIRIPTDSPATGPIVVNGQVFLGTTDEDVGGAYIWAFGVTP